MGDTILIITPSIGFGELIRQTLEETGSYQVALATNREETGSALTAPRFALCLLDGDMEDPSPEELGAEIRRRYPDISLVLIAPEGDLQPEMMAILSPVSVLSKPFYMPHLLAAVDQILAEGPGAEEHPPVVHESSAAASEADRTSPPPWLQDVDRAAQHLTRLTLESASQAALITRGDQLWAYAGELPEPAARELAEIVAAYWAKDGGSDFARFIRLGATGGEYMLYATGLVSDMVLSLVYDAKTRFSEIRSQAWRLARALASVPNHYEDSAPLDSQGTLEPETRPPAKPRASTGEPVEYGLPESSSGPALNDLPPEGGMLGDALAERPFAAGSLPNRVVSSESGEVPPPPAPAQGTLSTDQQAIPSAGAARSKEGQSSDIMGPVNPETRQPPARETLEEGQDALFLDPVSPAIHHLSYVCVLIPRLPQHQLAGDLKERLEIWLPQICVASGWRLRLVSVLPDRMQWIVNMTPEESPGKMVAVIRDVSSQRIFSAFPRLQQENISDDFWAPGYMILTSSQFPAEEPVLKFIRRTRAWQGFRE